VSRPVVVGIAGGSASGKSTLATALRTALEQEGRRVDVLASDPYMFHDLEHGPVFRSPSTGEIAFDCNRPDSIDWPAVLRDLDARINAPDAPDVLLVDGMMLLYIEDVRERLDLRLFVEMDADERAMRRMLRDLRSDRGLDTPEAIAAYYLESARVGHANYIEPSRVHADLIIRGDAPSQRVVPMLVSVVDSQLRDAGPLLEEAG
jgi:uridine kinase